MVKRGGILNKKCISMNKKPLSLAGEGGLVGQALKHKKHKNLKASVPVAALHTLQSHEWRPMKN